MFQQIISEKLNADFFSVPFAQVFLNLGENENILIPNLNNMRFLHITKKETKKGGQDTRKISF